MQLAQVSLEDRYTLDRGRIYVTGAQALTRLPILQRSRDAAAGLHTGGFISGYRGSPLGGYDIALWQAGDYLRDNHIRFQPGVNEDLAATAVWGTQQVGLHGDSDYDGVFGIWYGKGPGVDRSGDAFKHGNLAGSSPHGGVLVLCGDDPIAKSSTTAHQSEPALIAAGIPILNPANIQEYLDYGLAAIAMSRYSGCWVGMKCVTDTVEGSSSVSVGPGHMPLIKPTGHIVPPDGVHLRWPDAFPDQEKRLLNVKLPVARAFARANALDRISHDLPEGERRLGIVATGKAWADVIEAFQRLGISESIRVALGLTVYKVAMPWPLEPTGVRGFARGQEELLIVEEKRGLIEEQLATILYHSPAQPRLTGKCDEQGRALLPSHGELSADLLTEVLARRLLRLEPPERISERLTSTLPALSAGSDADTGQSEVSRMPYFCSGCPHNTSTNVPEGSRAFAGIGCHTMALFMDRRTELLTHMGGEGAQWIGNAPFSKDKHVFQNMGDGTYYHSGFLAIRAAVAAGVDITYKIFFNDAVDMTGGQPVEGQMTPLRIAQELAVEGVRRIVVMSDEPDKYPRGTPWPDGTAVKHRRELEATQQALRETGGVTALIYDQTCAAEKRRRRKRGQFPDPAKRVFINESVCEGCGDCGVQSNCVSVRPLETTFGRKRMIDQSTCNKDYACVDGFCPSFVTVHGGGVHKAGQASPAAADSPAPTGIPEPALPAMDGSYNILVTGIGGTGVITIGALLGMAAHLEGKGVSVLDQTGLAQKNGAVGSHIRLSAEPDELHSTRIGRGQADLLLGCDMVVAAGTEALATYQRGRTRAVVNNQVVPLAIFASNPDLPMQDKPMVDKISLAVGADNAFFLAATQQATALMGDAIYSNAFLMGHAWQKGLIPLSREAIQRAIELNGVSTGKNIQAFEWGRLAAHAPDAAASTANRHAPPQTPERAKSRDEMSLDEIVNHRAGHLADYQNAAYAKRYEQLVNRVREAESRVAPGREELTRAVAIYYAKLLAYKDEYEVARLYSRPLFREQLQAQFEGEYKLRLHLAPPLFAKRDPVTGHLRKKAFGPWVFKAFGVLARLRILRGTVFDPFGYTAERKLERRLIKDYETLVEDVLDRLSADNHEIAAELAATPEHIRGFGHVKQEHLEKAKQQETELLQRFRSGVEAQAPSAGASASGSV